MDITTYSKTITVGKYQRLYKIIDSFSGGNLYFLWIEVSKISGWAGIIWKMKLLSEKALLDLEEFDDKMIAAMKKEKDYYSSRTVSEVKKELRKFAEEIKETDPEFVKSRRLEYILPEIKILEKEVKTILELFKKNGFSFVGDVILKVSKYSEKNKRLKRLQFEYRNIEFDKESNQNILKEEDIEIARSADCSQFVDVKKRTGGKEWALCPFHRDTNPSLCCYEGDKGFFCFACNKGGDAITLVKELHGLEFKDAVNFINNKY